MLSEIKTRGVKDILIAVVDELKRVADAINTMFSRITAQTCIVCLIRNSLDYTGWKGRKLLVQALKPIYTVVSEEAAREAL